MSQEEASSSYQDEWKEMFSKADYMETLKLAAIKGSLKSSHFRSMCWKIFLKVLPEDKEDWIRVIKDQRFRYDELLDKFDVDPRNDDAKDISINNPLSQSVMSPWNQHFADNELKLKIKQDVVRTFPDIEFFRNSEIQDLMINILFIFARKCPYLEYKQGMHELLAPIIYVLYGDIQSYLHAAETDCLDMEIHILLNQNYFEHDAFSMFYRTMTLVEAWYVNDCNYFEQVEVIEFTSGKRRTPFPQDSLPGTLAYIWHNYFRSFDLELYNHLTSLEIAPQIYGIRWLRLLFGREFVIEDLLVVWDTIFADNIEYNLFKFIYVAMLISIRDLLLRSAYSSCLNHLMRFPNMENVQFIIDLALHLRDPIKYKQPESSRKSPTLLHVPEGKPTTRKGLSSTIGLGFAESIFRKNIENRPKSLSITSAHKHFDPIGVAVGSPMGTRPKSASLSGRPGKWGESNRSDSEDYSPNTSRSYSTLPRTSIRNVMEGKSHKYRASDLVQKPGRDSDKKNSGKAYREMVPLFPPISGAAPRSPTKELVDEIKTLKRKNAYLKKMNECCTQEITSHLCKLQGCLMSQKVKYEDEILVSLAGLKRARDMLSGTVHFDKNVVEDNKTTSRSTSGASSKHYTEDLSLEVGQLTLDSDSDSEYYRAASADSGAKKVSKKKGKKNSGSPVLFPDIHITKDKSFVTFPQDKNF